MSGGRTSRDGTIETVRVCIVHLAKRDHPDPYLNNIQGARISSELSDRAARRLQGLFSGEIKKCDFSPPKCREGD